MDSIDRKKNYRFHAEWGLEGKKKVKELDSEIEVLVVDVTEHEVERPKKNRRGTIAASRSVIP